MVSLSNSSGKSHPGVNQQNALFLKAIFAELQERRDDCVKLKEKLERYDVSCEMVYRNANEFYV